MRIFKKVNLNKYNFHFSESKGFLKLTQVQFDVVRLEFALDNPLREFTNRGWGSYPTYSYSTLLILINKGVIERVDKAYHAFEAIRYRFTRNWLAGVIQFLYEIPIGQYRAYRESS